MYNCNYTYVRGVIIRIQFRQIWITNPVLSHYTRKLRTVNNFIIINTGIEFPYLAVFQKFHYLPRDAGSFCGFFKVCNVTVETTHVQNPRWLSFHGISGENWTGLPMNFWFLMLRSKDLLVAICHRAFKNDSDNQSEKPYLICSSCRTGRLAAKIND